MKIKLVRPVFKCQKCNKTFTRKTPGPTPCIFCSHVYVDWLNYEQVIASLPKNWRTKTFEDVWLKRKSRYERNYYGKDS